MPPVGSGRCLDTGIRLCDPAIHVVFQFQFIIQPLVISIGEFFIVFIVFIIHILVEHCSAFIIAIILVCFIRVGILPISRRPACFAICQPAFKQSVQQHTNRGRKQRCRRIAGHTGYSTICFR